MYTHKQEGACTARICFTGVFLHGTDLHGAAWANPLHGAARTGKPLRLHGAARTAKQRQLHGAARTCGRTGPPIYPTANRPSILPRNLSHRNPNNRSGSARPTVHELHGIARTGGPTVLHGAARNVRCEPLHGIARNPCSSIASFTWAQVTAQHLPDNIIYYI